MAPETTKRDWRFWMIFLCLFLSQFLTATAVSTALPTIVNVLHGDQFIWIASAYTICSTALAPLSGGLAEVFGRKIVMFASILLFAAGSAICGASTPLNMLIAGRTVQGMGSGSISTMCQIILADLVPLRERGMFSGLISLSYTVANSTGPVVGGSLAQHGQWRWIFYLNIPICGCAAALVLGFLTLQTPAGAFGEKIARIDWIGNSLVMAATTSTMIGLTLGGIQYPWTSAHILVPLILGIAGLAAFMIYEVIFPKQPIVPYTLMTTRTAFSGYLQTVVLFTVSICVSYYMPVFFQATEDASPIASGVDIFGIAFVLAPSAILSGLSIRKTQKYRPQIIFAWVLTIIGFGLFTTLHANTPRAHAIGFQIIAGVGIGMLSTSLFFPILAPLPVESNAHAIALYTFFRNFSNILGVTIGGSVLQNFLKKNLPSDFSSTFPGGAAIAYSIIPRIPSLQEPLKTEVRTAFAESLRVLWQVMLGVSGMGLLISLTMKGLPLRTELDRKWGVRDDKNQTMKVQDEEVQDSKELTAVQVVDSSA
ncbi:iron permease [Lentinula guzmanii]|uniref:Iron permease n=1 Tax=Lentinula guzmanii TaxID=2804957 RepID=A0AA38JLG8_9AGAR|nr:iron permease [Lentinula guzmanii]